MCKERSKNLCYSIPPVRTYSSSDIDGLKWARWGYTFELKIINMDNYKLRLGYLFQTQKGDLLSVCDLSKSVNTETKSTTAFKVVDRSKFPLKYDWEAQPIPINKDWIKDLGFIHNRETNMKGLIEYTGIGMNTLSRGFRIHLTVKEGRYSLYVNSELVASKTIRFVHEFQDFCISNVGHRLVL